MKYIIPFNDFLNEARKISFPEVNQNSVDYYVSRFKAINNNNKIREFASKYLPHIKNPLDINQYKNFKDLETVVDYFNVEKASIDNIKDYSDEAIYNKNGIQIFLADTKEKCILYGNGSKWCISRNDGTNRFLSYRLDKHNKDYTFYFIFNRNLPETDKYSRIVIHVYDTKEEGVRWKCTNLNNDGDLGYELWDELVLDIPYLKGLKSIFIPKEDSEEEKGFKKLPTSVKGDDLFVELGSWKNVDAYISLFNEVTNKQLLNLPENLQKNALEYFLYLKYPSLELYNSLKNECKKYLLWFIKNNFRDNFLSFLSEYKNDKFTYEVAEFNEFKYERIIDCFDSNEYVTKYIKHITELKKDIKYLPSVLILNKESYILILNYKIKYPNNIHIHSNIRFDDFIQVEDHKFSEDDKNIIKEYAFKYSKSINTIKKLLELNIFYNNDLVDFIFKLDNVLYLRNFLTEFSLFDKINKKLLDKAIYNVFKHEITTLSFQETITNIIGKFISNVKPYYNEIECYILFKIFYYSYKEKYRPFKYRNTKFYYDFFVKKFGKDIDKINNEQGFSVKFLEWLDTFE